MNEYPNFDSPLGGEQPEAGHRPAAPAPLAPTSGSGACDKCGPVCDQGDPIRPCSACGETIGHGAHQYVCDCCGWECCTACSYDGPNGTVLCEDCQLTQEP